MHFTPDLLMTSHLTPRPITIHSPIRSKQHTLTPAFLGWRLLPLGDITGGGHALYLSTPQSGASRAPYTHPLGYRPCPHGDVTREATPPPQLHSRSWDWIPSMPWWPHRPALFDLGCVLAFLLLLGILLGLWVPVDCSPLAHLSP